MYKNIKGCRYAHYDTVYAECPRIVHRYEDSPCANCPKPDLLVRPKHDELATVGYEVPAWKLLVLALMFISAAALGLWLHAHYGIHIGACHR